MRNGAIRTTAVRCNRPSSTAAATAGNLRTARAARIRLNAWSSDMPSTRVQYANIDEHAAPAYSRRASTSPRCTSTAAVSRRSSRTSSPSRSTTSRSDIVDRLSAFIHLP